MGSCFEFATEICSDCEHPMVAGADSCTCAHCASVCTGRFSGCSAVWSSRASVLTLLRKPMVDGSGAQADSSLVGLFDEPPVRLPATGEARRHPGKKKNKARTPPTAPTPRIEAPQAADWELPRPELVEGLAHAPAVDPAVDALQERLNNLEGLLTSALDRVASLEAGLPDLQALRGHQDSAVEQADVRFTLVEVRLGAVERAVVERTDAVERRLAAMEAQLAGVDDLAATVAELGSSQAGQTEALEQRRASLDALTVRAQSGDERLGELAGLLHALDQRVGDGDSRVEQRIGELAGFMAALDQRVGDGDGQMEQRLEQRIKELAGVVASHADAGKRRCAKIESRLAENSEGLDRRVIDLTDTVVEHRHAVEQRVASQRGGGVELQQRLDQIEGITHRTAADHENVAESFSERLEALELRLAPTELGLARVNRLAKELTSFMSRVGPDQATAGDVDRRDRLRRHTP